METRIPKIRLMASPLKMGSSRINRAPIIAANADKVEQYRGGKEALFGFFVGQTMKAMQGKANPGVVNQLLKDKLG